MTLARLSDVLQPALRHGYAVPGFVCLGWEDARAYALAAQAEAAPVILQAGPGARAHMPLPIWAALLHQLARDVDIPLVPHLDHGMTAAECHQALDLGFPSVMFDGSRLPLAENIAATAAITAAAHAARASCEGEIGFVGYAAGLPSTGTDPVEAARFARDTDVDAMAISVGNTHLQTETIARIDRPRLQAIAAAAPGIPLVLHGGSGLSDALRRDLSSTTPICKLNIGTELRQTFGNALRQTLATDPALFDRLTILKTTEDPLTAAARAILRTLGASGRAA